ncbi:SPW repeat domain-containing protein [Adhaeribacter radiodurans]|uniref:SPW repeat-containing integral membrane domain-containing protein n=1 Tax=Adhaeribacter radiodurans TaxID=2745197 RepID=A0A7L7L8E0_9BACT|nr:hypothetical protein [Adhaeribacter radiodurans]QMU29090.1 hypothetical protein HUW48_14020 [Adhaeribacter radiodurans]
MKQPISRQMHGVADYSYIPTITAAPELFNFKEEKTATTLCRVLGGNLFLTSILTRAEWGLVKVLPFKAHLALDVAAGIFTASAPWLFGFADNTNARNAFLAFGLTSIAAASLSDPEELGEKED